MVVGEPKRSIMEGIENTGDVRLHDHRLRLKQRFDIIRKLGQGTYGKVQLGINKKTGQEVAIKTIKKCKIETEADLVRIRREVQIMSSVRHPNIVHIYEVFENSEKMILVMEYCAGGELYDYLSQQKVLQEDEARRLFRQIATAVYYCHKHKICHRDLKLENVLLDEHGSAKIADFGLSNVFEERRLLSTFCGSPLYASPEIVKGTPYIGPEVDCWSLGVLLYTLVYGAMPFDGSNFKRLVKQISTGDYFEPKNPSSASPLIRDMLTVDPIQRADITHICDNPWVNKGSDVSCLELAEALANETPVRLDLLLSLAPPPTIGSDKLVVTDEVSNAGADGSPARSMSVANIDNSAERRILEMVAEGGTDAIKPSPTRTIVSNDQPKRKLETTVSMDSAPSQRKKERSVRSSSGSRQNIPQNESEVTVLPYVENNVGSKQVEENVPMECQKEVNNEVQNNASQMNQNDIAPTQASPIKPPSSTVTTNMSQLTLEIANDIQNEPIIAQAPEEVSPVTAQTNKEPKAELKTKDPALKEKNNASKTTTAVKKKVVLSPSKKDDKSKSTAVKEKSPPRKSIEKDIAGRVLISDKKTEEKKSDEAPVPNDAQSTKQPAERRRSRILDTAVKLNNLSIQPTAGSSENTQSPPPPAKPKKVIIPGVSVGSFKEQFERRASLTSGNVPAPSNDLRKNSIKTPAVTNNTTNNKTLAGKKVNSVDSEHPPSTFVNENKDTTNIKLQTIGIEPSPLPQPKEEPPKPLQEPKKPAIVEVNKVSKLLHKSESLKEPSRKDALTTNLSLEDARRNLQQSMALLNQAKSDVKPVENTDDLQNERQKQLKTAREIISNAIGEDGKKVQRICMGSKPPVPYGSGGRSSSGTISLNSLNSLPGSPPTSPPHPRPLVRESPARTFRTEVQHRVDDVRNRYLPNSRGGSVERIIPIHFADDNTKVPNSHTSSSGQLPYQRNNSMPFRLGSLPRGCTPDFETERTHQPSTPVTPATPPTPASISRAEPIKKSPREFIIPIAVEGKGYVTPRQGSLEPSETPSKLTPTNIGFASRFPKPRRLSSLVSGGESEDEDDLHMHRLRSSRRVRADAEKESVSSGEEDDEEGFELLTAENLFSTLLDRVRSLTNKLNGEEGTGFPQHHQSLFNNFHSPFFNSPHLPRKHKRHNIIVHKVKTERASSETREGPSWRRSTSRDIGSDFDSIFPSHPTFPRGSKKSRKAASNKCNQKSTHPQMSSDLESDSTKNTNESETNSNENLDLSDLDFSKMELSEKDMETLSGLTPALSRRLQKQLLDHLPPAAARSLRRTLSMNCPNMLDGKSAQHKYTRSLSASKYSDKKVSLLEEENISSIKSDQNDQFIKNENQIDKNSLHKISNKYKLSSFDDEDTSSISYSSTLSKPDKDNNNILKSNSREYSDSNILKRDQSGNSLDINNSRVDGLSVTESITPRLLSGMRDTPDRSVLSKYFSPEKNVYMDDYSQNRNKSELENVTNEPYYTSHTSQNMVLNNIDLTGSLRRRSTRTPPVETTPRRKISRFLRPDFFDTPREESIYVRDKKDKETETQKVLKEIREKRSRSASSPNSPSISNDVPFFDSISKTNSRNCLSPVSPTTPNRSRSVTPFYPILDNISEAQNDYNANKEIHETLISVDKKLKSSSNSSKNEIDNCISVPTPVDINANNKVSETCAQFTLKESKLTRPKSFPSKPTENLCIFGETVDDKNSDFNSNNTVEKTSVKESKIARPKSYPTTTPSPEKKSINIPVNEIGMSKNIKKDETNLNAKDHSTVVAPLREKTPILSDNNGNVAVSFNINLPSKNAKPLKAEEKVPQGNCEEEIKKVSPVKKKVLVKKKTSSLKLASAKNSSNDSNKIENSIENKETDCAKTTPKENDSKASPVKKKSVLQSIGQKFEKLRNDSFNKLNSQEKESTVEKTQKATEIKDEPKVTRVENAMRVLREQSVPVVQVEPITESGLIKRAVTITNLPTLDNKESSSKKSVNRVLGLFKKVEPKDKTNKSGLTPSVEKNKESNEPLPNPDLDALLQNDLSNDDSNLSQIIENKPKRPTSLLLNGIGKRVQACYNGATSDSVISKSDKKLNNNVDNGNACKSDETKSQKKGLRLDFSRLPKINQNIFNKRNSLDLSKSRESSVSKDLNGNQKSDSLLNNGAQQSDSLKPNDSSIDQSKNSSVNHDIEESFSNGDISTQDPNWSPDYDANKLMSSEQQSKSSEYTQNSHNSHDVASSEPENIIDRIRRKSFYSRFNEKKNRRKSLLVGPGAKEYIPSARINPQCENDNLHYASKYDLSPTSPTKYVPSALNFDHARPSHSLDKVDCLTPTSPRLRSMIGNDPFLSGVHKSTERADQKYPDFGTSSGIDSGSYSIPRYPRTISYFDNFDSKPVSMEPKSTSARYGRTLSLLSPGIYATYSPRSHTRNPAILLRDSAEIESNSEDILTKIRNRKKAAAQNSYVDDDHSLDTKFRSNHMHDSEHDLSADKVE